MFNHFQFQLHFKHLARIAFSKKAFMIEPLRRIELSTSSLPRKCSTTELQRLNFERKTGLEPATLSLEGWCSTKWATSANNQNYPRNKTLILFLSFYFKELLPQFLEGYLLYLWGEKDSNLRSFRNGFTVRPIWPLWYLPFDFGKIEPMEGFEPPTSWLQISCSGQLSYIGNTL